MKKRMSLALFALWLPTAFAAYLPLERIHLPPGFRISLYAKDVPDARQMALGPKGTVFVGTRRIGKVYALIPNADHTAAQQTRVIAQNLNVPNGVAVHGGALYVAEISRILRFANIEENLQQPPQSTVIRNDLPDKGLHGWRYIKFSPDGWLYVAIGSPCNSCLLTDELTGSIVRMQPDGKNLQSYASGIRNSVGFAWQPDSPYLWFTDNGRDLLGDDIPPDELNIAPQPGLHFGFPYLHGKSVPDPKFGGQYDESKITKPVLELGAHVAALGMTFYTANRFPAKYKNQIFVAEHGSWNRSKKVGYKVSLVTVEGTRVTGYQPFASGWLQGEEAWGRPVDTLVMPDGALLISDDRAGVIYRITYNDTQKEN